ncbi:glycerate kinase [Mycobacterium xenopi]|uniref:Glycerate kinase n=2 Tax=Mycobacterium xenopi TaxID=1789 RepID=A0AAD1LZC4_MYCXE|nr:glycerate kinase [Mycobacterium xenopi]EUA23791.1 glycerate kinase family protein [Mycobacterium xenopi 4042]EUA52011.1 glycerate kinase family protein [Mycobacterium xenopi 3993]MDA3641641.1 glycerate kinase [Mycobacterium xenopi]MDA3659399.1 glycerate kinase [Mycobacterium xenopi]MDA3663849.1 glycerate kinase [Mycobacterium xenopi]
MPTVLIAPDKFEGSLAAAEAVGDGGSASADGGAGFLAGLGAQLLDAARSAVSDGGVALSSIASVDLAAALDSMDGVHLMLDSEVDNPLTGPKGTAAVYGPQKSDESEQVRELAASLTHFADVVAVTTRSDYRDHAGAGAAGGTGVAALVLGAEFRPA